MYSVLNKRLEYIYTFTCQKTLFDTCLLLVLKIVEDLQCILNDYKVYQIVFRARIFHVLSNQTIDAY